MAAAVAFVLATGLRVTPPCRAAGPASAVENSVVKVFSTVRSPDVFRPWTKQPSSEITGSGVVIEGKRILTNAHVVLYAGQVQVQGNKSGDKYSATVEAIAPGIDLAVLRLDDESFFDTRPPLPRSRSLPEVKDAVLAYGFPTGGTSLSITKGIISRIEFVPYNFPVSGLRIQIDAAINHGNSGGPAVAGDRMIGLAFSTENNAQNISYIIPSEEIDLFLGQVSTGPYQGKPTLFDQTQKLQNPALRRFLRLGTDARGVIVFLPAGDGPGYPLKKWDVITRIGSAPIDDEGMVEIGPNLRVRFDYLVQKIARDGLVPLTLIRDGKELRVDAPVPSRRPLLIEDLAGAYPDYFIYGPIVLSTATSQYISGFNRDAKDNFEFFGSPLFTRRGVLPAFPGEKLVVVSSPFFPDRLSQAYTNPVGWVVKAVDGIPIRNLPQLVQVLRDAKGEFVTIEYFGRAFEMMVFPRKSMLEATDNILNDNDVRAQGTPELMKIWNAGRAE